MIPQDKLVPLMVSHGYTLYRQPGGEPYAIYRYTKRNKKTGAIERVEERVPMDDVSRWQRNETAKDVYAELKAELELWNKWQEANT